MKSSEASTNSSISSRRPSQLPLQSEVKCWCGKNAVEWISFTKLNPGRRFVRCSNRDSGCKFWNWVEEPLSPIVRSVMDDEVRKLKTTSRNFCLGMVICCCVVVSLLFNCQLCRCGCNCSCGRFGGFRSID